MMSVLRWLFPPAALPCVTCRCHSPRDRIRPCGGAAAGVSLYAPSYMEPLPDGTCCLDGARGHRQRDIRRLFLPVLRAACKLFGTVCSRRSPGTWQARTMDRWHFWRHPRNGRIAAPVHHPARRNTAPACAIVGGLRVLAMAVAITSAPGIATVPSRPLRQLERESGAARADQSSFLFQHAQHHCVTDTIGPRVCRAHGQSPGRHEPVAFSAARSISSR